MNHTKTIIETEEQFLNEIAKAATQSLIVVDTEYHKTNTWGEARIIGVSWGYPVGSSFVSFYAPFRHMEFPGTKNLDPKLIIEFNRFTGTQVYHNFMADWQVFMWDGVDISRHYIFDTMVASHLINENERSFSLDQLSLKYFKARKKSLGALSMEWERIPPQIMGDYACIDVFLTYRQYVRCKAGLQEQGLDNLYDDYQLFIKALARVVSRGLHIDATLASQLQEEGRKELNLIQQKLGFKPSSQQLVAKRLHDPTDFGLPVLYVTKKGAPSTSSLHLRRYSDRYPEVKEFVSDVLRFRTVYKAVTTWYEGFLTKRGTDGLLHPGLTVVGGSQTDEERRGGTVTGRLSCREPNLQQVPRTGPARRLLTCPSGVRLIECDYSQAELRMIGHYLEKAANDPTVANAYREKTDIHAITAENMELLSSLDFKSARQVGKTCNFSLAYRAGVKQLQTILYRDAGLDAPMDQVAVWHKAWHKTYPGITELNERAEAQAKKFNYVRMWNGRRRHLTQQKDWAKAFNSIIQGGVGQIIVYAMTEIDRQLPDLQVVLSVHDSILFYVPEHKAEEISLKVIDIMERVPVQFTDIPFNVDWKPYNAS